MFIHWGVYSVPAWRKVTPGLYASYAEWYYARVMDDTVNGGKEFHDRVYGEDFEYRDFGPMFKAELFDPVEWANIFKRAGARYVVLTSKHHDGYCLWDTKSPYKADWNSVAVGPQRDLLSELTASVKARGMKMGIYYSIVEWETHQRKGNYMIDEKYVRKYRIPENEYVDNHLQFQLKELVEDYEPSLIFFDAGEWEGDDNYWKSKEFLSWLYSESSVKDEVVVNDRFFKGMTARHGDYYSSEYKDAEGVGIRHPWEESRGIGGSYGFNRDEDIDDYASTEELIHELIEIVSRGGNLLLNVGPTADGRIPVIMQERLVEIGEWLSINGEAIYNTHPIDEKLISHNEHVFCTEKENAYYLLFTEWPESVIVINPFTVQVKKVSVLGYEKNIVWNQADRRLSITPPMINIPQIPCRHAWVFKIEFER
ncbi:MAG: alpha-L-fucosidase [Bacteroidales bacterium]